MKITGKDKVLAAITVLMLLGGMIGLGDNEDMLTLYFSSWITAPLLSLPLSLISKYLWKEDGFLEWVIVAFILISFYIQYSVGTQSCLVGRILSVMAVIILYFDYKHHKKEE